MLTAAEIPPATAAAVWNDVSDFKWLKATKSPNWAELPEGERAAPVALRHA